MKKYQHYNDAPGRSFTNSTQKQRQPLRPLNDLTEIARTYNIKKTTDSALLSLFMRTNGKYSSSFAPSSGLRGILLSSEPIVPEGPEC